MGTEAAAPSSEQAEALRAWSAHLARTSARGLLVLAGPAAWAEAGVAVMAAHRQAPVWHLAWNEAIEGVLGQEAEIVHQAAHEGLDVDLLAAASGAVRAGGVLILTVPDPAAWSSASDEAVQRHLSHGYQAADYGDRFLTRLQGLLGERPEAWLVTPATVPSLPPVVEPQPAPKPPPDPDCVTADQVKAVQTIQRLARGRARRPLILAADRGRGKSTALGIAAQRLQAANPAPTIIATAPRRSSAARMLERAAIPFWPPDELLRQAPEADVVLIDEAAGIPIPLLLELSQRYNRVAFATTVHGYEGTGRGFARRFDDHLRAQGQQPRRLTLDQPIRWRPDDPLEAFVTEALLLDSEAPEGSGPLNTVQRLDRDHLTHNEPLLRGVFGLLVSAHYRTRPADLRQLLDAPEIEVHAALDAEGRPLGVALTAAEGPLPDELREPIWLGQRRVRGHLTPQSLTTHAGHAQAAALAYRRIMRIAVAASERRRGVGSALIEAITASASAQGCDAVAASFGATAELLPFWRANGLWPVRLGHRRDRASGTHSAILLRALTDRASDLTTRLRGDLQDQLSHQLPSAFHELEPALVRELAYQLPAADLSETDWWQIAAVAVGQRSRLDALPALTRLTWAVLTASLDDEPRDTRVDVLILAVLQQTGETQTARRLGLRGQRACEACLRDVVLRLAEADAPEPARDFINNGRD
jgi:tRNA(Met) cytidine acetyltransferase